MGNLEVAVVAFLAGAGVSALLVKIIARIYINRLEKERMNDIESKNCKVIYQEFRKKKSSWE